MPPNQIIRNRVFCPSLKLSSQIRGCDTPYQPNYDVFILMPKILPKRSMDLKEISSLPRLRSHSRAQSIVCLLFGRNSVVPQGMDGLRSSVTHFSLPLCALLHFVS